MLDVGVGEISPKFYMYILPIEKYFLNTPQNLQVSDTCRIKTQLWVPATFARNEPNAAPCKYTKNCLFCKCKSKMFRSKIKIICFNINIVWKDKGGNIMFSPHISVIFTISLFVQCSHTKLFVMTTGKIKMWQLIDIQSSLSRIICKISVHKIAGMSMIASAELWHNY